MNTSYVNINNQNKRTKVIFGQNTWSSHCWWSLSSDKGPFQRNIQPQIGLLTIPHHVMSTLIRPWRSTSQITRYYASLHITSGRKVKKQRLRNVRMQMYSLRPAMCKLAEECKHLGNVLLECQHIAAVPASAMIHEHSLLLADFYGVNPLTRH